MMLLILTLIGLFTAAYCLLILLYLYWFLKVKKYVLKEEVIPATRFSVIIPARNEEAVITHCLKRILEQNYPADLFQIIVVNDHSTDATADRVLAIAKTNSNVQLIQLADYVDANINAYKKRAIEIAVAESNGDWIVTTDADCIAPKNWLLQFDHFIQQKNPVFIAAPVMFSLTPSWLGLFQVLDFMSLQGITAAAVAAGSHTMCNGANLAYKKEAFERVGKFKGIDHIASGDDMLLMYKIKQHYPHQLGFIYSSNMIVQTAPMTTWKEFLNQRIRWASKANSYSDKTILPVLVLVYCFNVLLLIALLTGIFIQGLYPWVCYSLMLKTIVEFIFMIPVARFFGLTNTLFFFPLMQPFHIVYTVIAGWLGKFGTYQWKGRMVK